MIIEVMWHVHDLITCITKEILSLYKDTDMFLAFILWQNECYQVKTRLGEALLMSTTTYDL